MVASAVYLRQVEVVWAPPPMTQQNGIIRRYIVNVTSVDGGEELITYSQATTTLVQNLDPFTTYACSISAETVSQGPFSPPIVFRTAEDGEVLHHSDYVDSVSSSCQVLWITTVCVCVCLLSPLGPSDSPQAVRRTAVTSTSVNLSWFPPSTEHHNGVIRNYTVMVVVQDTGEIFTRSTVQLSINFESLHPYYTYNFSVSAVTITHGPYSVPLIVQTLPDSKS